MRYSLLSALRMCLAGVALVCIVGCFSGAWGQTKATVRGPRWSTVPDTFLVQVTNFMRLTKLPAATEAADKFGATWTTLSVSERAHVMSAAVEFDKRQYRYTFYQAMMELVVQASQSLGADKANEEALMDCLEKTAVQEPPKNWFLFCDRVKFFLANKAIYFNKFYGLQVGQAPFTFEYKGQSAAIPDTIPLSMPESTETQQKLDSWNSEPAPLVDDPAASTASVSGNPDVGPEVELPPLEGAIIRFPKVDLTFATGYDTATLAGTSGTFMITKDHWVGTGGRFHWGTAGLGPDAVFADLSTYHFPVRFPHILAENATLTYPSKLSGTVKGAFEFKSVKHAPGRSPFPKFISYGAVTQYKDIGEEVTLTGGFSLQGQKINTSALHLGQSTLTIRHKGKEVYRGVSRRFELDSTISSLGVYSVLPRGLDSLTQAHARLIYEKAPKSKIRLYKNTGRYKEAPFFDSYFRTEITCEALFYSLDSNKIDFINQSNGLRAPVVIESMDYFTPDRYADVQGINTYSPIGIVVANYIRTNKNLVFYADDIAEHYKLKSAQVRASMQSLANEGFISYDPITGQGEIGTKLQHYYSSIKKYKDYDYIAILSIAPDAKMNARIDLDSNLLFVYGVDRFTISDSIEAYIKPKNRMLKISQNRDFQFAGEVQAGNFLINGSDFNFNYRNYQIDLKHIDSIDVLGDKKAATVRQRNKNATRLSGLNRNDTAVGASKFTRGVLFLNKPDNKSNRIKMPQYPIFDVQAPSFVYFDKPSILGGAYDKKVYFYVPPFKVDSIAGANLAAIAFNGTFSSDNIFPEFKERLEVRTDKSMGFDHTVPPEGYPLYKGPGKFFGTLSLDKRGLRGKGTIKYLTTTIQSDDFIFYQDSVIAKGQSVNMEKGTYGDSAAYPDAHVTDYSMKWKTKADTMYLTNTGKTPWYFYSKRVRLNGTLAINKLGAFGSGLIRASGSRAESPAYSFKQDRLEGRHAFFEVQSSNPVKPAFASKNVKFNFFVDDEYAEFSPEEEGAAANEFPYARYRTSIPKAVWDLKKKKVVMSTQDSTTRGTFYSTLPEQDSLNFKGSTAVYDIAKAKLNISGVSYIRVADGLVIPDSGKVEILENAEMQPLKNCTLILDTANRYHKLIKANITVKGRFSFEGEATYLYVNTVNDTLPIKFNKFEFIHEGKKPKDGEDPFVYTKSGGEIEEEKPLKIAKGVLFKGVATMWANRPALEFQGFVKLDLKKTDTEWLKYETNGESKEFVLDLKSAQDANGDPVTTGIFQENGSGELYGVFVNGKRNKEDHEIFSSTGVMNFNSVTGDFKVGPADKLAGKTTEGNVFSYNDSTSQTVFEGKLNFLNKSQDDFTMDASGVGKGQMDSANYLVRTFMGLKMKLPEKAWEEMVKVIRQRAKDIGYSEAMGDKEILTQRITDLFGKRGAEEYRKAGNKNWHEAMPKFAKGITFTELPLLWQPKQAAFFTPLSDTKDKYAKLPILNIFTNNINAQLDGYLEIKKADNLDLVTLYIEAAPDAWWYFSFDDQLRLAVLSSQEPFNDAVRAKAKPGRGGQYFFEVVDEVERVQFLKHFRTEYLNQTINEDEYKITRKVEEEDADQPKPESVGEKSDEGAQAEASADSTNEGSKKELAAKKSKKNKKNKKEKKAETDDKPVAEKPDDDGFGGAPVEKPVGTPSEADSTTNPAKAAPEPDPLPDKTPEPAVEKPAETQPADPTPAEPAPTETKSADPTPAEPAPTETKSADPTPDSTAAPAKTEPAPTSDTPAAPPDGTPTPTEPPKEGEAPKEEKK